MMIIVPRCGFNRNTHHSIIYGPQQLGGAEFRHIAVEQGVLKVAYFIRHWRLKSLVGELLKCSVAWLQVSVGVSYLVFQKPQSIFLIWNPSGLPRCCVSSLNMDSVFTWTTRTCQYHSVKMTSTLWTSLWLQIIPHPPKFES
jgi:hypothetical protein